MVRADDKVWVMRRHRAGAFRRAMILGFVMIGIGASAGYAQQPAAPAPPPLWTGSGGVGISLTSGNSDTANYSFTFDVTHDPPSPNLLKWAGLYLRGEQDGETTVNRTSLGVRDEYRVWTRGFVFAQLDYLRDTFKEIDYLVAPTGGLGFRVIDTEPTKFAVDAGIGGVWEKNPLLEVDASGAVIAGEQLEHRLNTAATIKHATTGLWKTDDFGDSLYTFSVGLATALATHLQLAIDLRDTYKSRPPTPTTKKNDVALVTTLAVKY
jgi:putative salt-induced outer membrane protein YdiY